MLRTFIAGIIRSERSVKSHWRQDQLKYLTAPFESGGFPYVQLGSRRGQRCVPVGSQAHC